MATLWPRPIWPVPLLGFLAAGVLTWSMVRHDVWQRAERLEPTDTPTFLAGTILSGAGFFILERAAEVWTGRVIAGLVLLGVVALFVWRLRNPVGLFAAAAGIGYLAAGPVGRGLVSAGSSVHLLVVLGGGLTGMGVVGAVSRQGRLRAVTMSALLWVGVLTAAAANPRGLLRAPVGWTIGFGLPLVYLGLGLALVQRLGPVDLTRGEKRD
jgi:hypothetical protein